MKISWRGTAAVGLSWAFGDLVLSRVGVSGVWGYITMAAVYLVLGLTPGQTRNQVLYAGVTGPMLGSVVGIGILAAICPRQAAEGVGEAILSAAMISAARTERGPGCGIPEVGATRAPNCLTQAPGEMAPSSTCSNVRAHA